MDKIQELHLPRYYEEPDLLILDEPTNHLDLTSIEWLEKILKDHNKAIILISIL